MWLSDKSISFELDVHFVWNCSSSILNLQFNLSGSWKAYLQWWFVYPDTFVPGRYFRINEISGLLNRPLVRTWKSVPTLFVRTSEISGLSEPGLTNHHCISEWHKHNHDQVWYYQKIYKTVSYRMNIASPSSADMECVSYSLVHCSLVACYMSPKPYCMYMSTH